MQQQAATTAVPQPTAAVTPAAPAAPAEEPQVLSEAKMREQLLKKQKELLELQQKKLELELLQTKARLEEQQKQLERQTGQLHGQPEHVQVGSCAQLLYLQSQQLQLGLAPCCLVFQKSTLNSSLNRTSVVVYRKTVWWLKSMLYYKIFNAHL